MSDPFSVVRQAHRICAAYYQQIFPLLNETAQKLDTTFLYWDTWSFCKPPQSNKNPLESWKWDYLPALDFSVVFSRQKNPTAPMTCDDFVLDFNLITDSELESERREKQYGKNEEPVATDLKVTVESAESYLRVFLFSATTNEGIYDSPYDLWNSYENYPETTSSVYHSDDDQIKGIGFVLPLSAIAHDNGINVLLQKINEHLTIMQLQ
jgi:hypothetical protein